MNLKKMAFSILNAGLILGLLACTLNESSFRSTPQNVEASDVNIRAKQSFNVAMWCGERKETFTMDGDDFTSLEQFSTEVELVLPQKRILGIIPGPSSTFIFLETFTLTDPSNFQTPGTMTPLVYGEIQSGKTIRISCDEILQLPTRIDGASVVLERLSDALGGEDYFHGVLTIETDTNDLKVFQNKIVRSSSCIDQGSGFECLESQLDRTRSEIESVGTNLTREVENELDPAEQLDFPTPIIFDCRAADNSRDVCSVNSDGTNFTTVADDLDSGGVPGFDLPYGNAFGQAVFQCFDAVFNNSVCVGTAGVTGSTILVEDTNMGLTPNFRAFDINNSGQITLRCASATDNDILCVVNADGSGFAEILDPADIPPYDTFNISKLNDLGQIVFECGDTTGGDDICGVNFDGSGFHIIANDTNGNAEPGYFFPEINNLGQVVFVCGDLGGSSGICSGNFGTNGVTELIPDPTGDSNPPGYFDPRINDLGQIVFSCFDAGFKLSLCGGQFGSTDFDFIIEGSIPGAGPQYFNGYFLPGNVGSKIAFQCVGATLTEDICVINFDGTGFLQVTNDPTPGDSVAPVFILPSIF